MTNFELGVRVPLVIRAPWLPSAVGVKTAALAEAVDLFPTLTELAGLPLPPADQVLQGTSLAPLLRDPRCAPHHLGVLLLVWRLLNSSLLTPSWPHDDDAQLLRILFVINAPHSKAARCSRFCCSPRRLLCTEHSRGTLLATDAALSRCSLFPCKPSPDSTSH